MMRRILCALMSACMLAGCSEGGPKSCSVAVAASLPLLTGTRMPTVQASLSGQKVALLIDTGASTSMIAPSAADRFGLDGGENPRSVTLEGIGGATIAPIVTVRHLELGYGHAHDIDLPVGTTMQGDIQGLPLLGLFGADFLSNYDVDIDVPQHRFAMYHLRECGSIQPFDGPYFEVPFRLDGTAILVDLKIDGTPVVAQLDSGASFTTITQDDADRIGVTANLLSADRIRRRMIGVDTNTVEGTVHRFGSLEIGDERMNNFRFVVAPIATDHTLLGDDFLHFNRVWISYSLKRLFIQPAFGNRLVRLDPATGAAPASR